MKKLWLSILLTVVLLNFSYAQNTSPLPTGPVGIGTTSPASGLMLDVVGNGSFSGTLSLGLGGAATNIFQQTLAHNYYGISGVSYPGQFRWYASPNNSLYKDNALFQLRSWDAGTNTENTMATFTGGGNFGIGVVPTGGRLHVLGAAGLSPIYLAGETSEGEFLTATKSNGGWATHFYTSGGHAATDQALRVGNAEGNALFTALYNGNFGIGTTNPKDYLHVFSGTANSLTTAARLSGGDGGSDAGTSLLFTSAYSDGSWLTGRVGALSSGYGTDYGSSLVFHTNSGASTATLTEKMRIDKNGNVGIGTTSPTSKLFLSAAENQATLNAGVPAHLVINSFNVSSLGPDMVFGTTNTGGPYGWIQMRNPGINGMAYDLALNPLGGNVGIGTTNPGAALSVVNSNPVIQLFDADFNQADHTSMGKIAFGSGVSEWASIGATRVGTQLDDLSALVFSTSFSPNLGGGTGINKEKMRIDYNGNVGIGTSNPVAKLDVNGTIYSGNSAADRGFSGLTTIDGSALSFYWPSGTSNIDYGGQITGGQVAGWGSVSLRPQNTVFGHTALSDTYASGIDVTYPTLYFSTNGVERVRVDANGNVAIGTTTPYPNAKFQTKLNTNINLGIDPGTGTGSVRLDAYNDAANANIPLELQGSTISLFGSGGALGLTVNSSGNVGVGTTDPKGYRFAVAGNAVAEQMTVLLQTNWHDYVFEKDYTLMPLDELSNYVNKNHHLPEIPSAAEIKKDGLNLGEMNGLLVKKVEELTLYLIEKEKEIMDLKADKQARNEQDKQQNERLKKLEEQLDALLKGGKQ